MIYQAHFVDHSGENHYAVAQKQERLRQVAQERKFSIKSIEKSEAWDDELWVRVLGNESDDVVYFTSL